MIEIRLDWKNSLPILLKLSHCEERHATFVEFHINDDDTHTKGQSWVQDPAPEIAYVFCI